jgi:hypothetical protein
MASPSKYTSGHVRVTEPEPPAATVAAFTGELAGWVAHMKKVQHLSTPRAVIACEPFKKLAGMGPAIVPLILTRYVDVEIPWAALLARLHPEAKLADGLTGDAWAERERWFEWAEKRGLLQRT